MLSRRSIVLSGLGTALVQVTANAEDQPPAPLSTTPPPEQPKPRQPSISEQLEHIAVLLKTEDSKGIQYTATGFMFLFFKQDTRGVEAIVTNKHVVEGMKKISLRWTKKKPSGEPDFGNFVDTVIDDLDNRIIIHPSVDLAMIAVSDILSKYTSESRPVFALGIDQTLVPSEDDLKNFQPLEDILVVGFPDGLSDSQNNIPIYRRGITATPVYMKYNGQRQFMIDAAIYHGSSGSPVFLYNVGSWINHDGQTMSGTRVGLLGVVWGVFELPTEGEIRLVPAPTQYQPKALSKIPHNLGACIPSYCILDFEPEIVKRGYKPPEGYKMRAQP